VATADWITVDDVARYLDIPGDVTGDDNLATATAAVKAAVERRRSDLYAGDPPAFAPTDDVRAGSIMWAGLIYQTRSAPSGFAGYGDDTQLYDALGARRAEVMRLIGWRRPVAI
jgi:hypothetical protein